MINQYIKTKIFLFFIYKKLFTIKITRMQQRAKHYLEQNEFLENSILKKANFTQKNSIKQSLVQLTNQNFINNNKNNSNNNKFNSQIFFTQAQRQIIESIERKQQHDDILFKMSKKKPVLKKLQVINNLNQQVNHNHNKLLKSKSHSEFKQKKVLFLNEHNYGMGNSNIKLLKKPSAEIFFKNRYNQYQKQLNFNIGKMEILCEKYFGGIQNNRVQHDKIQLKNNQIAIYYAKVLPKNFSLPKIFKSKETQTLKPIKQIKQITHDMKIQSKIKKQKSNSFNHQQFFIHQSQNQKQIKYINNINQKRSFSKQQYIKRIEMNLKSEDLISRALKIKQLNLSNKQVTNLINQVQKKYKRNPLFCQNQNNRSISSLNI